MFNALFGRFFGKKPLFALSTGNKRNKPVQMVTQYRGIVWAELLNFAVAWPCYWLFKPYGAYFLLFATCTAFLACVVFFADLCIDYSAREKRVRNETKTWNTIKQEHAKNRNVQYLANAAGVNIPIGAKPAKAQQHSNRDRERERDNRHLLPARAERTERAGNEISRDEQRRLLDQELAAARHEDERGRDRPHRHQQEFVHHSAPPLPDR